MNFDSVEFKRIFSLSTYKNMKIRLGAMTFFKDFVNDTRGDLYPVIEKSSDCVEQVKNNRYFVKQGFSKRLLSRFFPFATYELTATPINRGSVGFCFKLDSTEATITVSDSSVVFIGSDRREQLPLPAFPDGTRTMIVSCRCGAFDVYLKSADKPEYFCTFSDSAFINSNDYSVFSNGYALLYADNSVTVNEVLSYIDNGVALADTRPIKYENGDVLSEQGKVYFTASVRMQSGAFQGVFSWVPGTAELDMTGALFFDPGNGKWSSYLASVILYNRYAKQWYVWVSSFEHEHILAHAAFDGDPRFGVNVIDVEIMPKAPEGSDISAFMGFRGDEDPDLLYDKENDRWLLAICRPDPKTKQYVYTFFQSKHPFSDYTYIGKGYDGAETGGSFVKADGEIFFVCGNDFNSTSNYRIYSRRGMKNARFNYPDGGFRGWGSVFPITLGSRTRYFWLTFDRHRGSDYNWSYGNLYCFEADIR